jgi:spore coat polysaccharide biosynthesis protein SpsF
MNELKQTKIGIITQARMTSTRLPGKIFKEVNHKSLLKYHTQRLQQSGIDVIIATTTNGTDDVVQQFAEKEQLKFYRGDEDNVLSRYHEAAVKFGLEMIIRVTSDCPLIDPHLIRNNLEKYLKFNNPQLYMANGMERSFARGFDFEIFSFQLLDQAFKNATDEGDLEHVTPYIWKNRSGKVEFYQVKQTTDNSRFRITVDTPEDFELIKELIEKYKADQLSYTEIEHILITHPELSAINAHIEQKKV